MQTLVRDVLQDAFWGRKLEEVAQILRCFDRGVAEELESSDYRDRKVVGIVRYCIPFFEFSRAIDYVEPNPSWLAAMYLWSETWRPMDNVIDREGSLTRNFYEYNVSFLRAWRFQAGLAPTSTLMATYLECLKDTLDAASNNQGEASVAEIFRRARLFEVVFDQMPNLSDATVSKFRTYINLLTIPHDLGDIVTDLREGRQTFATTALKRVDPHCRMTAANFRKLLDYAQKEFSAQKTKLEVESLRGSWVAARNIETFEKWAFKS